MLNNGYQNLSLENIDISVGGTAAKLKDALARLLTNKIVILGDIVLNGEEKLPVGVECDISVSLSTEPDDWDPDVDGEFIPENIYSVTFKDVYGYDLTITDNEVVTSTHQSAVDSNIEDLIESGTIDNAKPIYFHPIRFDISGSLQGGYNCKVKSGSIMILNNDPTPIDTYAKLVTYLDNNGDRIDILCSVDFFDNNGDYVGQILSIGATSVSINVYFSVDGATLKNSNLSNVELSVVSDSVNKIN